MLSEISETEIKSMTKEQNYLRGYADCKKDMSSKNLIEIPENSTIGDVIRAVFPDWKIEHVKKMSGLNRYDINIDNFNRFSFYEDFWNSPYQKEAMTNGDVIKDLFNPKEYEGEKIMTNGDAIKDLFNPKEYEIKVLGNWVEIEIQRLGINFSCELKWWNAPCQSKEKESATVAKFHDFYPEDHTTWPPADKELLVKNNVGDNYIAYLEYDDGEDGGWGFYSENGDVIADLDEIDAWMPIPQHERDKNYIPIQERKAKNLTLHIGDLSPEEEKDR